MIQNKNDLSRFRRFTIHLVEKYCPFNVGLFQVLTGTVTALLLGVVLVLGWRSSAKVKEVVTEDFNQQQLVLAKHAARQIENNLFTLKNELSLLSLSPSIQYFEKVFLDKRIGITFSRVQEEGVLEIRYIESSGKRTHLVDSNGYQTVHPYPECISYLRWAEEEKNKGKILFSDIIPTIYGSDYQKLVLKIAIPVWQVSVDESHPVATNRFSGALVFVVDATSLTGKITSDIKSGKTGYAWVIDEKGTFLFHPEKEFKGKNAFEARKEKRPTISFSRINEIQKEKMLKGEEGTSWYVSGWHRGVEGEMKKLIAYAPIRLNGKTGEQIWSVAVVAPMREVEDVIHSIHVRQIVLQAIIIVVILLGGILMVSLILNWSHFMEQEVEKKTIEVKRSEQRYKSLVENAEDIIFVVDHHGNFLSINKYGARFLQKETGNIIGHNMSDILLWPGSEDLLLMIQEVFNTKKSMQFTHPIKVGDHEYWLNTNLRRLWDEAGNIYAVLGISRDVTDRRKMEEHSYHTEKLASMGILAAGVAHEINNPLAIMLGFTDLLLEKTKKESQEYEMLKTVEKHGFHAKQVVENLLSFARYSEQKEEDIDMNKNIENVLSVTGNNLSLSRISVKKELAEGLPLVRGNHQELQQVFFNIINNAAYVMKKGGTLAITTSVIDGNTIEIRFKDTGPGIGKEIRSRIFDPLFTTKKVGEGTGLGLSVSYGIVTKYGGSITFETKTVEESGEDHGTTFIITLPAIKTS